MSAPESFIEGVRSQSVLVRRNTERALARQDAGDYGGSRPYVETAFEQAKDLEEFVAEAAAREIHECSCGHTHYLHGDAV